MPIPELSAIGGCSSQAARGTLIFGARLRGERDEARLILAGLASLGVSAPPLAGAPIALHSEVVQAQIPAYPPTSPALVAPAPPLDPQAEIPPPAPSLSYVWQPCIGRGTACNIFGRRGDMSRGRGICDLYTRILGAAGERLGRSRRALGLPGCRQQHT